MEEEERQRPLQAQEYAASLQVLREGHAGDLVRANVTSERACSRHMEETVFKPLLNQWLKPRIVIHKYACIDINICTYIYIYI